MFLYFPKPDTPYLAIQKTKALGPIRELSPEEHSFFHSNYAIINEHFNDCKLFLISLMNYNEYITIMNSYETRSKEDLSTHPTEMGGAIMALNINRSILNFLSSARTFLDHIERRLKHRYGKDSPEFSSFKRQTSEAFDQSFSYRFLYKLRNYVQHCGMPVGSMSLTAGYANDETSEVLQSLDVRFKRDTLLADFDSWGEKVGDDLRQQPEFFSIRPHIEDLMTWLERFQISLMARANLEIIESMRALDTLIAEASEVEGTPCIGVQRIDPQDPGESTITLETFPLEVMGFFRKSFEKTFGAGMTDFFSHTEKRVPPG